MARCADLNERVDSGGVETDERERNGVRARAGAKEKCANGLTAQKRVGLSRGNLVNTRQLVVRQTVGEQGRHGGREVVGRRQFGRIAVGRIVFKRICVVVVVVAGVGHEVDGHGVSQVAQQHRELDGALHIFNAGDFVAHVIQLHLNRPQRVQAAVGDGGEPRGVGGVDVVRQRQRGGRVRRTRVLTDGRRADCAARPAAAGARAPA
jgi:hypothetical protein